MKPASPHLYSRHSIDLSAGERAAGPAGQVVRPEVLKEGCPEQGSDVCDQRGEGGIPENMQVANWN